MKIFRTSNNYLHSWSIKVLCDYYDTFQKVKIRFKEIDLTKIPLIYEPAAIRN